MLNYKINLNFWGKFKKKINEIFKISKRIVSLGQERVI